MRRPPDTIVYLTFDGLLSPLGHSQVFRLVMGLAKSGFRYEIHSLERESDLADSARVRRTERALADAGVAWHRIRYDSGGGARSAAVNIRRATVALAARVARGGVRLVHARGYHAGAVALLVRSGTGIEYIFDARGYWIDERLDERRWFTNVHVLSTARALERQLYSRAAAVVTLTALHADDIRSSPTFSGRRRPLVTTIPTCADYQEFVTSGRPARQDPVIGLVGSVNPSYRTREAAELCRKILELSPAARLVVLTHQQDQLRAILQESRVPMARVELTSVTQDEMPACLREIDWGVMLLSESRAKRASMPTKLAEFFASGVRPLHYGCNAEVSEWIRRAGSGIILRSLSPRDLTEAAHTVVGSGAAPPALLEHARAVTAPHFSLTSGIARYRDLLDQL